MTYNVAKDVREFVYEEGAFATPESEHWLIEYEHEHEHHRRVKHCHIQTKRGEDIPGVVYGTPANTHELERMYSGYFNRTTLVTGIMFGKRALLGETRCTCIRKDHADQFSHPVIALPSLAEARVREGGIGLVDIISEATVDSGELGLLPGLGFGLTPPGAGRTRGFIPAAEGIQRYSLASPNPDGLVSVPPRADLTVDLVRGMDFSRSKPTALGGELPSYGGLPRLRRNIGAGLSAFFQKQEEDFEASIDRVRARCPDHCIDNSVVFILQDVELDIGKFLPNMGETRMLAAHYQFNLGAGRIKKFKAKKRKEKRREPKV